MKLKLLLPWLCVLGLLVGLGALYSSNQKQAAELAKSNQELEQARAAVEEAKKAPAESPELIQLRKENQDVLRLRNEVNQLRGEKQQLARQVQTVQAQVQRAQAQVQNAQAQALRVNGTPADQALTPEQQAQAAFRARYGLSAPTPEQEKATACINNLLQIEGAKQQWALQNSKPAGGLVGATDLAAYLKSNTVPTCPAGGIYTLNPIGINPICNIPGHVLPK